MSIETTLAPPYSNGANSISHFQKMEQLRLIRREKFRKILMYCDVAPSNTLVFEELNILISKLGMDTFTPTARANYLQIRDGSLIALNSVLNKHNHFFISEIKTVMDADHAIALQNGLLPLQITEHNLRLLPLEEIEFLAKQLAGESPVWEAAKTGFTNLRSPLFALFSLSMIGFMFGWNFRDFISSTIAGQGPILGLLLILSLLVYGVITGVKKYHKLTLERDKNGQEAVYVARKTVIAALEKVLAEQKRLYKNTLESALKQ